MAKTARITVYEGKYHQIRRMLAAIGNRAKTVHRVQVGPIQLGDLPVGQWRLLSNAEIEQLNNSSVTSDNSSSVTNNTEEEIEEELD